MLPHAHQWHLNNEYVPLEIIAELAELGVFALTGGIAIFYLITMVVGMFGVPMSFMLAGFLTLLLPVKTCEVINSAGVRSSHVYLLREAMAMLPTAHQSTPTEAVPAAAAAMAVHAGAPALANVG